MRTQVITQTKHISFEKDKILTIHDFDESEYELNAFIYRMTLNIYIQYARKVGRLLIR